MYNDKLYSGRIWIAFYFQGTLKNKVRLYFDTFAELDDWLKGMVNSEEWLLEGIIDDRIQYGLLIFEDATLADIANGNFRINGHKAIIEHGGFWYI